ncbi:hypothetical protein [Marinobacter sp. MDS2]|uniref:hypothetical protein n=1 Tax=Marinobacter sp. MDS2 TaxID=3065961 RepID=UPI00273C4566|nr:hypothetical protein [Marinobacter sp. MDS2]MDP4546485.1 hypothetical protein [Marinobacter sp. MDS2]
MKLQHAAFRGEIPILDPRLLPENNAQVARNLDLRRGTLRPQRDTLAAGQLPATINPANLWRYDQGNAGAGHWFSWGAEYDIDVVRSPVANDAYARVYWTGQGAPKMSTLAIATSGSGPYPSNWYDLGVPAPSSSPIVSVPAGRSEIPDTAVEVVYVVTMVTEYGEEGPPSDPSGTAMRWDDVSGAPPSGHLDVALPPVPPGDHNITKKRLYRAESGGVYQLAAEVTAATASVSDTTLSENLGLALASTFWDGPGPSMTGLTLLPGGILAGFFGNTLAFSEAYLPHAWPTGYQLAFDDPIVAIAAVSGGLVVTTTGQPWLVTGSSPEAMAQMELDVNQPCIAKRSMVDMGGYALYAGYDGLVAIGGSEAQVITNTTLTREQWQALSPKTLHGYRHDGAYLGFYDGGSFRFTPGAGIEFFEVQASGGYYDVAEDILYLIQGANITQWGEGAPLAYTWRSRVHELPPGSAAFTCGQIIADSYPVRLLVYADGLTVLDFAIPSGAMFRMPAGFALRREWEIELQATSEIRSVQLATSPVELV